MSNKTFFIAALVLAFVAGLSTVFFASSRKAPEEVRVTDFPSAFGEWQGRDVTLEEKIYQILGTRNLFIREYTNPSGEKVYLYIVYSEDDRKVSHPPEICMMGGGSTILKKTVVPMTDAIRGNRLLIAQGPQPTELVVYWFKAGRLYTHNYFRQQIQTVLDRLLRRRTASAMIRVSAAIRDNNEAASLTLLRSFTRSIEPLLAQYVP